MTADHQDHLQQLIEIGLALSSERHPDVLLDMVVSKARSFSGCDGGTLFLASEDRRKLIWTIIQSESLGLHMRRGDAGRWAPIELFEDSELPVTSNVAAYVAHIRETVNIPDVYDDPRFDFVGPRQFDQRTGYRTKSMLVVPLVHYDGGLIGVLQLINARSKNDGGTVAFDPFFEDHVRFLASQAAVAVKTAQLFREVEEQFEAFTQAIAMAIDQKSPYTGDHVRKVVALTMMIAQGMNEAQEGRFSEVQFTRQELKELQAAAWLHDVGKIVTPQHIVDKPTKLTKVYDRLELIRLRYSYCQEKVLRAGLEEKLLAVQPQTVEATESIRFDKIDARVQEECRQLQDELEVIVRCNLGSESMRNTDLQVIRSIKDNGDRQLSRLTEDEAVNLSVHRGTLTDSERDVVRHHAQVTLDILSALPFARHFRNVPEIAASHHEKLNGTGYPRGLTADQLSTRARILAVADIFEALTASDRPYRGPAPLSRALEIMDQMVEEGEIDPDIVQFARDEGVFDRYAAIELSPEQIDIQLAVTTD